MPALENFFEEQITGEQGRKRQDRTGRREERRERHKRLTGQPATLEKRSRCFCPDPSLALPPEEVILHYLSIHSPHHTEMRLFPFPIAWNQPQTLEIQWSRRICLSTSTSKENACEGGRSLPQDFRLLLQFTTAITTSTNMKLKSQQ